MKPFTPAPKGIKPEFTVEPKKQLIPRSLDPTCLLPDYELYTPQAYSWQKVNKDIDRLTDMDPYHIIQIMRTMSCQGIKYCRAWYLFDQELKRKVAPKDEDNSHQPYGYPIVGMTGRITRLNGGKPVVISHGPGYAKI